MSFHQPATNRSKAEYTPPPLASLSDSVPFCACDGERVLLASVRASWGSTGGLQVLLAKCLYR